MLPQLSLFEKPPVIVQEPIIPKGVLPCMTAEFLALRDEYVTLDEIIDKATKKYKGHLYREEGSNVVASQFHGGAWFSPKNAVRFDAEFGEQSVRRRALQRLIKNLNEASVHEFSLTLSNGVSISVRYAGWFDRCGHYDFNGEKNDFNETGYLSHFAYGFPVSTEEIELFGKSVIENHLTKFIKKSKGKTAKRKADNSVLVQDFDC